MGKFLRNIWVMMTVVAVTSCAAACGMATYKIGAEASLNTGNSAILNLLINVGGIALAVGAAFLLYFILRAMGNALLGAGQRNKMVSAFSRLWIVFGVLILAGCGATCAFSGGVFMIDPASNAETGSAVIPTLINLLLTTGLAIIGAVFALTAFFVVCGWLAIGPFNHLRIDRLERRIEELEARLNAE